MDRHTIGKRIRLAREKVGYSQAELAERCSFKGQSRISNYEKGDREPTVAELIQIATALHVEPSWLILGVGRQNAPLQASQGAAPYTVDPEAADMAALWQRLPEFKRDLYKQLIEHDAALAHVMPWYMKIAKPKGERFAGWEKTLQVGFDAHLKQLKLAL